MKKFLLNLSMLTFVALSVSACPSPGTSNNSSASPSAGATPSTGATTSPGTSSGTFETRASFIAYLNCIKTTNPSVAPAIDVYVSQVNALSDQQWSTSRPLYEIATKSYASATCN